MRNECDGALVENIKLIGMWRYNSDGIDVCAPRWRCYNEFKRKIPFPYKTSSTCDILHVTARPQKAAFPVAWK